MSKKDLRKYDDGPWKIRKEPQNSGSHSYMIIDKMGHSLAMWGNKDNITLMAAAPKLVRRLAIRILDSAELYVRYDPPKILTEREAFDYYLRYQEDDLAVLADALSCQPEDITLGALKVIAEGE
jgi:hypothetical protein